MSLDIHDATGYIPIIETAMSQPERTTTMTLKTISTSAGDFKVRVDEHTTDTEIAQKIARKLGYRDGWATNSSGSRGSFQANIGRTSGSSMSVARTVTVYR
jgi:hypothetical protein